MSLLATPERYAGRVVRVIGFVKLEFEGNAVYLHREDFENGISKNAVWLGPFDLDGGPPRKLEDYCIVEGVFTPDQKGHFGMFGGSLTHVTRLERWRATAFRRAEKLEK